MGLRVAGDGDVFLVAGDIAGGQHNDIEMVNRFLAHLKGRNFARATRRAYAYDALNFLRFLAEQGVGLAQVRSSDLFDYLDWQTQPRRTAGSTVVRLSERPGAAPATQNRRIAAICLHVGKRVRQLTEDDFAAVLGQLDGLAGLSVSARHHARTRLFGLPQACYQLGSLTTPPRQSGPVAVGPPVHAAGVRQPLIRASVVRYVQTITTTLRPYTVAGPNQGVAGVLRLTR